jgi:prevent-host-death family protein
MEVSITQFRRDLFTLVDQAMSGREVWVTHKGRRFKIMPDDAPSDRLDRITPLQVVNPDSSEKDEKLLQLEMQAAWERDWDSL